MSWAVSHCYPLYTKSLMYESSIEHLRVTVTQQPRNRINSFVEPRPNQMIIIWYFTNNVWNSVTCVGQLGHLVQAANWFAPTLNLFHPLKVGNINLGYTNPHVWDATGEKSRSGPQRLWLTKRHETVKLMLPEGGRTMCEWDDDMCWCERASVFCGHISLHLYRETGLHADV